MQRFVAGSATHDLWREAADAALEQAGTIPASANLGFVYIADDWTDEFSAIVRYLKDRTGIAHWVGTVGIGISASSHEYHETPALSLLIGSFPEDSFRIVPTLSEDLTAFREALAPWYSRHPAHTAVVHVDPRNAGAGTLVSQLAETLPGGFLVGGISSSRGNSHPQVADEVTDGGLSGVVFDAEVPVVSGLTQGCTPISPVHEVTEAERNVVSGLDGRPALDVFYEDIGELLARDLNRVAGYIFVGMPLAGSDTGDYLVRNLVGVDTQRKLLGIGDIVQPGQSMMFCRRDGNTAREDLQRMVRDVRGRASGTPRGALYFSCLGRGPNLFGENSDELRIVREELGDVPLAGFFCNGEISHDRLYGYTGVLTLFM